MLNEMTLVKSLLAKTDKSGRHTGAAQSHTAAEQAAFRRQIAKRRQKPVLYLVT